MHENRPGVAKIRSHHRLTLTGVDRWSRSILCSHFYELTRVFIFCIDNFVFVLLCANMTGVFMHKRRFIVLILLSATLSILHSKRRIKTVLVGHAIRQGVGGILIGRLTLANSGLRFQD